MFMQDTLQIWSLQVQKMQRRHEAKTEEKAQHIEELIEGSRKASSLVRITHWQQLLFLFPVKNDMPTTVLKYIMSFSLSKAQRIQRLGKSFNKKETSSDLTSRGSLCRRQSVTCAGRWQTMHSRLLSSKMNPRKVV